METNKIKEEIFKNAKRLTKIEKDLWTCRENYFGKNHWKRLAKKERLISEKITLENRTNILRKSLTFCGLLVVAGFVKIKFLI